MIETITSRQNPLIRHVSKLLTNRSYRYETRQFAGDGTKLLAEAAQWCEGLDTVLFTDELPCELPPDVRLVKIPSALMKQISPMQTPQGALFVCRMPAAAELRMPRGCIVLDDLQDPGNLGTILRTADAFGISVILTEGCTDPYNPKVVRAAMGALFRTKPQSASKDTIIAQCRAAGIPLLCADLDDTSVDLRRRDLSGAAIVIGNEGNGVSQQLCDAADGRIIIPMQPHCESLNAAVAAAVCMWELRRTQE
jgi:TrmH family RNA methyltransferase